MAHAALTHTSRLYCDLKTSKIAFFFWKSFGPGLCSLVFSTFSLCPQYDPSTSMAFPLRLYCVPKATPRRSSATQMRLCYVLCVLTATLRRLLRLCCDYGELTRTQQKCRVSATVLCMFKIFADGDLVCPWVPRYDLAASLLRPWRLCCVLGRSKDAVRSRGMCEGSLEKMVSQHLITIYLKRSPETVPEC